jgi:hypothetical protein
MREGSVILQWQKSNEGMVRGIAEGDGRKPTRKSPELGLGAFINASNLKIHGSVALRQPSGSNRLKLPTSNNRG